MIVYIDGEKEPPENDVSISSPLRAQKAFGIIDVSKHSGHGWMGRNWERTWRFTVCKRKDLLRRSWLRRVTFIRHHLG